jgi:hypothetical protein
MQLQLHLAQWHIRGSKLTTVKQASYCCLMFVNLVRLLLLLLLLLLLESSVAL